MGYLFLFYFDTTCIKHVCLSSFVVFCSEFFCRVYEASLPVRCRAGKQLYSDEIMTAGKLAKFPVIPNRHSISDKNYGINFPCVFHSLFSVFNMGFLFARIPDFCSYISTLSFTWRQHLLARKESLSGRQFFWDRESRPQSLGWGRRWPRFLRDRMTIWTYCELRQFASHHISSEYNCSAACYNSKRGYCQSCRKSRNLHTVGSCSLCLS